MKEFEVSVSVRWPGAGWSWCASVRVLAPSPGVALFALVPDLELAGWDLVALCPAEARFRPGPAVPPVAPVLRVSAVAVAALAARRLPVRPSIVPDFYFRLAAV